MPDSATEFTAWFNFWMALLYTGLGVFAVVAVVVSVRGWQEIKKMLRKLKE